MRHEKFIETEIGLFQNYIIKYLMRPMTEHFPQKYQDLGQFPCVSRTQCISLDYANMINLKEESICDERGVSRCTLLL